MQEGEVKPWVVQVQAQRIFPIYTAANRIRCLAIRQTFDVLHHHNEGQAPGGHLHGATLRRVEIGKELIVIERTELGAEVNIEVAFGEGRAYSRSRRGGNGGKGFGT